MARSGCELASATWPRCEAVARVSPTSTACLLRGDSHTVEDLARTPSTSTAGQTTLAVPCVRRKTDRSGTFGGSAATRAGPTRLPGPRGRGDRNWRESCHGCLLQADCGWSAVLRERVAAHDLRRDYTYRRWHCSIRLSHRDGCHDRSMADGRACNRRRIPRNAWQEAFLTAGSAQGPAKRLPRPAGSYRLGALVPTGGRRRRQWAGWGTADRRRSCRPGRRPAVWPAGPA